MLIEWPSATFCSTHLAPSRFCLSAGWTDRLRINPNLSTRIWRFPPFIFCLYHSLWAPFFCRFYRLTINMRSLYLPACSRTSSPNFSSTPWSSHTHFSRRESHWEALAMNTLLCQCKIPYSPPLLSHISLGDLFFSPREFIFDYPPFLITHLTRVFFIQTMILAQYSYFCLVFRYPLSFCSTLSFFISHDLITTLSLLILETWLKILYNQIL